MRGEREGRERRRDSEVRGERREGGRDSEVRGEREREGREGGIVR